MAENTPNSSENLAKIGLSNPENRPRYYRKIIRITGDHSPNVRYAKAQIAAGIKPTNEIILPGVLSWGDYSKRRATWDEIKQSIGLDAIFYEGSEVLLYPPAWLNRAEEYARQLTGQKRVPKAMGVDPAEGGDKTSMVVVDELGIIEIVSRKTPDTAQIHIAALALMRKHNIPAQSVVFDKGGGGKQIVDMMRQSGYNVRSVGFGESVIRDPKKTASSIKERINLKEESYAYYNRRAEMYGLLRILLDPSLGKGFAIPAEYTNLRSELAPIPLLYAPPEGRMYLPPKYKRGPKSEEKCLVDIIGHSPDEADALVLAIYAMTHKTTRIKVGVF